VAGSCVYSDEPLGSGATELVSYNRNTMTNITSIMMFWVLALCRVANVTGKLFPSWHCPGPD
jgi:hypothetical protein